MHTFSRRSTTAVKRLAVALLAVAALGGPAAVPTVASARSCPGGYVHAVIDGREKCLHAGEFCKHVDDAQYRRYGFRCIRYYVNVHRYRLTRA
jgi:hypothetical protein